MVRGKFLQSLLQVVLAILLGVAAPSSAATAAGDRIGGTLPDGSPWEAKMPLNWNGVLILDLDRIRGAPTGTPPTSSRPSPIEHARGAFQDWLWAEGYALAGTAREPAGFDNGRAVENLVQVREQFIRKWGKPKWTVALGSSRGAFVGRKDLEIHPEIFDGALVFSGGGSGMIAGLNDKLNSIFALKTLVDPASPVKLVNVGDFRAEDEAVAQLISKAMATPQGRARFALAAAYEQFARWSSFDKPKPAPDDYDAQLAQMSQNFIFGNSAVIRAGVEKTAGGNVSWNEGVDYSELLRRSGRLPMVAALYRRAGLNLQSELARLRAAPRIVADPAAVARAEKIMTYSGRIRAPIVEVDNNNDPVDSESSKIAYLQTLQRAGTAGMFRLLWCDGAGHGGQTALDRAVAMTLLMNRITTGKWGPTTLAALNNAAQAVAKSSSIDLGSPTFFQPQVAQPLSTWDGANWGTYRPSMQSVRSHN